MQQLDEQLIIDYLRGDSGAFEVLVQRYLRPIYGFVYRYVGDERDAEDTTQEVFVKAWRSLKKFDQSKSFKTWIFAIAKNTTIDFLKKKKTISFSAFENEKGENSLLETFADPASSAQELLEQQEFSLAFTGAINKLSLQYRTVLFLRCNDNFTFKEIAEFLGESLNTIKSRYRRAVIILRNLAQ
ncbi:MAG: sigma-70 family RNA polymerase sigma factor [Candidatus Harrisonbacteria bacterium]|nr:sigma-70 family RNA polymerase sigma factor [Candidatus Harrisonbacteria bacterium]